MNASMNYSLHPFHDYGRGDDDCSNGQWGHNCHLGHCSFVLMHIFLVPKPSFKIARVSSVQSSYASGIVRPVQKPPQA